MVGIDHLPQNLVKVGIAIIAIIAINQTVGREMEVINLSGLSSLPFVLEALLHIPSFYRPTYAWHLLPVVCSCEKDHQQELDVEAFELLKID